MSKFEKIFWGWILFFATIFFILIILAKINHEDRKIKKPIIGQYIFKIQKSQKISQNLSKNSDKINIILFENISELNSTIKSNIDEIFENIDENIDNFLDFHYSIKGEYTELGMMAFSKIEKLLQEKLLGKDFLEKLSKKSNIFDKTFQKQKEEFANHVSKIALHDIDKNLNKLTLKTLHLDIERNILATNIKIGTLLMVKIGGKFLKYLTVKISSKIVTKTATKVGAKTSSKLISAGNGAAMGTICGPFAWICAPVAATAFWFGTDAIVIKTDEFFNREKLKKEIQQALKNAQERLEQSFQNLYQERFINFSQELQKELKNTPILEEKKIKIKDKF